MTMRRFDNRPPGAALALLPAILWSAACDSMVPNRPPEVLVSVTLGFETELLDPPATRQMDVADWFSDPDGDPLTFSARSSHPEVVAASLSGAILTITLTAVGHAAVTVTATDPGGLYAASSVQVEVREPNRPPLAIGSIPAVRVHENKPFEMDVLWHFRDPDGDPLVYAAEASDSGLVAIAANGSVIGLSAVATGTTTLTVTATDPDGLSASHQVAVQSFAGAPGFRDDFDDAELQGWQLVNALSETATGVAAWTNVAAGEPGRLARGAVRRLTEWQAGLRVARAHEDAVVRLVIHTEDLTTPSLAAEIGSGVDFGGGDTNARLFVLFDQGGSPTWFPLDAGLSGAIHDGAGEFTDLTVAIHEMRFSLVAGSDTALSVNLAALGAPSAVGVMTGVELWIVPLDSTGAGRGGLVDWIEVGGTLADSADDSPATLPAASSAEPPAGQWPAATTGSARAARRRSRM